MRKPDTSTTPRERLSAEQLFAYADKYARRHEKEGDGTQYPTVRQAARRFKVPQKVIREVAEEGCGWYGYLGLIVAVRAGSGVGELDGGDQQVEAYSDA